MLKKFEFTQKQKDFIGERISTLSQYEQAFVHLRFWEDYDMEEIAYLMKVPINRLRIIQESSFEKLRAEFEVAFPELFDEAKNENAAA